MKTLQVSWYPPDPQFDPDADILGINTFHTTLKSAGGLEHPAWQKVIGWLQIHRLADLSKEGPIHLEWLEEKHDFPIYMVSKFAGYPSSKALPLEDLCKYWLYDDHPSFASSFDYAVAMGIHLGYKRIVMRNVHLVSRRESMLEAPSLMLWVGLAKLHGVTVDMTESRLWEKTLYGFESRGIPLWADQDLARDLIVDYVNPEARNWFKMYSMYKTKAFDAIYGQATALPANFESLNREVAQEKMADYYEMYKEAADELDKAE